MHGSFFPILFGWLAGFILLGLWALWFHRKQQTAVADARENHSREVKRREAVEKDLMQAQQTLEQMNERLMQMDKMVVLGTMVASIAHDIVGPANFSKISADLARNKMEEIKEIILMIFSKQEGQKAHDIMKRFQELFLSHEENVLAIEEGLSLLITISQSIRNHSRLDVEFEREQSLQAIIQETLTILGSRSRRLEIKVQVSPEAKITCRRAQIGQIFLNLVSNAIDSLTPLGSQGQIMISCHPLVYEGQFGWEFLVEDNGEGFSTGNLNQLGEAFFTTKPVGKGTGLGLSIVKKIVNNHQGILSFEKSPTLGGACIRFWLPVRPNHIESKGA